MPSQFDIDAFGETLADDVTAAEQSLPPLPEFLTQTHMDTIIRPHTMKRGFARAIGNALDPPWVAALPNTNDPLTARLAAGWLNKGDGWVAAAIQKVPLMRRAWIRGYVFTNGSSPLILTLPPLLIPAQNELIVTMIDFQPAYLNLWIDGTLSVNYAEATTRQHVILDHSYQTAF